MRWTNAYGEVLEETATGVRFVTRNPSAAHNAQRPAEPAFLEPRPYTESPTTSLPPRPANREAVAEVAFLDPVPYVRLSERR
jgi:hypothetical protein